MHRHRQNEEVYGIVGGRDQFLVDGECIDVQEGSVLRLAPAAARACKKLGALAAAAFKGSWEAMVMPASGVEFAQRDDNTLTVADLILAYAKGVEELRLAVAGMSGEQQRSSPVAGKWSTLEVVCHLADCEQFFADRMKRTVAMERPLLLGAEGFRYPEALRYQEHDLEQEIELIAITRQQMAHTLRLIAPDAWQRTAVHSEIGLVTLRQLVLHAINHLRHHLRFVSEKRAAMAAPRAPSTTKTAAHNVAGL